MTQKKPPSVSRLIDLANIMALHIHEPHDYEYDYRMPFSYCPYEICAYIRDEMIAIDRQLEKDFGEDNAARTHSSKQE